MRRLLLLSVVMSMAAAACSDSAGEDEAPTATGTPSVVTTLPATTTTPPSTPTTPVTTEGVETTTTVATTTTTAPLVPLDELELEWAAVADGFSQPVFVTTAPGDERLFVVDQPGVIWVIDASSTIRFLDINELVAFRGERGLLGLAFHPDYQSNGRFFVNYIDNGGDTVVAEFLVGADGLADPSTRRPILEVGQPASNHNGGMIAFGPDGYLWIGMGDGGGADDRFGQGQRADTLLAAMLRIDVDGGDPYAVPADNPYADGEDGAPEVWAIGLRNPWRWSFDGDRILIGDVGQNQREEVNVAAVTDAGLNYGWPIMEATACFQRSGCDTDGLVMPVIEYRHDAGCSITGGYVYRGSAIPELDGQYFYGDYCQGWVRSSAIDGAGVAGESRQWSDPGTLSGLTSFGVDAAGELYATTADGRLWRLQRVD